MRKDAHLYSCPEPLQLSGSLKGLCGKEVAEPVIVAGPWDSIAVGQKLNTQELIGICAKCRKQSVDGRFVYAVTEKRYAGKDDDGE